MRHGTYRRVVSVRTWVPIERGRRISYIGLMYLDLECGHVAMRIAPRAGRYKGAYCKQCVGATEALPAKGSLGLWRYQPAGEVTR